MACQLSADCLDEIFEYLEEDKHSLYACLLVNRLWCKISVRILWRNIWNLKLNIDQQSLILSTLFACFYKLSQICHNLRSISITFYDDNVSSELQELISLQKNLRYLTLSANPDG